MRAVRRTLQAAGVRDAEIHARRLAEYREMEEAAAYMPATPAYLGSVAEAQNQLQLLRERLSEIQHRLGKRSARGLMDKPRSGNLDARWAALVRRSHPERFEQLDRDVLDARRNLAEAVRLGNTAALSGLRTAVDVTEYQARRAELAFRKGEKWDIFKMAHEAAPKLLAELERYEADLLPAEAASLQAAINASNTQAPVRDMAPTRDPEPATTPAYSP
ncbi:hypothetical protein SAMN04487779_102718 [Belnapia rosea]|uniref:Uncharacterized protein n=1 Tax=Belnapia rosea TaxID=938405 RepID=A0A1G7BTQ4_9PROT|nr:hypothetical protein SAMN04487779_102718 [Belnapia rosea]